MVNKLKFHHLSKHVNVRCHGNNKILLIQNEASLDVLYQTGSSSYSGPFNPIR